MAPAASTSEVGIPALLSVAALLALTTLRHDFGLNAIHSGYAVWAMSLVLVCVGAWIPRGKVNLGGPPRQARREGPPCGYTRHLRAERAEKR